jgi:hypothetical protein
MEQTITTLSYSIADIPATLESWVVLHAVTYCCMVY